MNFRVVSLVTLTCFACTASAADWNVDPKVTLRYEYDDNNRLSANPDNVISVSGGLLDAQVEFSAATPRSKLNLTPRVRASKYPDEEHDEITDAMLNVGWNYRSLRSIAGLDFDYERKTVLGRYLADEPDRDDGGLGDPDPGTGSGRVTDPTDRDEFRIQPSYGVQLTERTQMLVHAEYLDVEFDDQVASERVNFNTVEAGVGVRFRTSPTAAVTVFAGGSRYEPEERPDAKSQYATVEWSNSISEVSRVYVRGGANRVKSDIAGSNWETGFSGGAGVQWKFEVTELFLDYNRYVDPSSAGLVVNRDQLRLKLRRRLSERSNFNVAARAIKDGKVRNLDELEDREYFAGSLEYEWRFSRPASVTVGYQYTWREYEDDPTDADSNRFYLGIRYQPKRL